MKSDFKLFQSASTAALFFAHAHASWDLKMGILLTSIVVGTGLVFILDQCVQSVDPARGSTHEYASVEKLRKESLTLRREKLVNPISKEL